MKRDTQLVGAAGEHLVLSRLLNRQYLAAQAPPGAAKVDILVNHLDDKPPRLIQVKTITGKDINNGWHMSESTKKLSTPPSFIVLWLLEISKVTFMLFHRRLSQLL